MEIRYHMMPMGTTPDFVTRIDYSVLAFDGNVWIDLENLKNLANGEIICLPVPFTDESFAKAFSTLEKNDGYVIISSMENWNMICFAWLSENLELKFKPRSKIIVKNGTFKISQYLVDAACENNKGLLALAAMMLA